MRATAAMDGIATALLRQRKGAALALLGSPGTAHLVPKARLALDPLTINPEAYLILNP